MCNNTLITIYIAITDQSNPDSGAFYIFACSHWSLGFAKQHLEYTKHHEIPFQWFKKYQIVLKPNQGLIFGSNIFHQIHGNKTSKDRLSAWWVLQIKDEFLDKEWVDNNLPDVQWSTYNLEKFHKEVGWIVDRKKSSKWDAS